VMEPLKDSSHTSVWDMTLPVVTERGLSSESVKLGSIRGRPALIEFMASWCVYCQRMAPMVEELYRKYGDSVLFVSIAGSWRGANESTTVDFIRRFHTSWPHLFDRQNNVSQYFNVQSIPTYVFLNSNGEEVQRIEGVVPLERLASELERLR